MRTITKLAGLAGIAMLAACTPQDGAQPEQTPPAPSNPDACGASRVASYVGAQRTEDTLAKIKAASGAKTMRVVGPDDMMTQDFRQDRLTITTDASGRIKTVTCV